MPRKSIPLPHVEISRTSCGNKRDPWWMMWGSVMMILLVWSGRSEAQFQPQVREPITVMKAQALREEGPHVLLLLVKGLTAEKSSNGLSAWKSMELAGTWFQQVYVPMLGSDNAIRTSILTGTLPWENGISDNTRDWRQALLLENKPSLPELFRQAGFFTVGAGRVYHQWLDQQGGKTVKRGFDQMRAWDLRLQSENGDRHQVNEVVKFLRKKQTIPFFITLGLESPETVEGAMLKLNEVLVRQGLEKETVVMVLGLPDEKHSTHTPMAMWLRLAGEKLNTATSTMIEHPVSAIDAFPTLVEAVGGIKIPEGLNGRSLLPLMRDPSAKREGEIVMINGTEEAFDVTVIHEGWSYLKTRDGNEQLENINGDSDQHEEVKKRLAALAPNSWAAYSRPISKVLFDAAADGNTVYWLQGGDDFAAEELPDLTGRGLEIEMELDYDERADANAVMISAGDEGLGFAVHFEEGRPAVTIRYDGLNTTLATKENLKSGRVVLRALFGVDASLDVAAGDVQAHGYAPMEGGFPRQLTGALKVGHGGAVLPKGASFGGNLHKVAFSVLPGASAEQRAAKATPVE